MILFPNCKINLGLHVLAKREDGFHEIETCFYHVPWTDILEVIPAQKFSFTTSGLDIPGESEDNLCVKAFELLREKFNLNPVAMHLHKVVPMGAGLGAGSSDAAATLMSINEIFNLKLSYHELKGFASQLGSDCSFFLKNKPSIGKGKGDELTEVSVSLRGKHLIIIKPPIHVSTKDAYSGIELKSGRESVASIVSKNPLENWKDTLVNDFEESIFKKYPSIKNLKSRLYESGALYASMSGSGSSVYGIFQKSIPVDREFEEMDSWSGQL